MLAKTILYMQRQSGLDLPHQGNKSNWIYGISLWYFIFRVAGFLVSDTLEYRVQKYFFVMEVNECIRKEPSYMRSSSYFAALHQTLYYYYMYSKVQSVGLL